MTFWQLLSAFGDPFLTLALSAILLWWLVAIGRKQAARVWAVYLGLATLLVGISKFAYAGWGISIDVLHFTVISGHTMLASAVYPVVCYLCALGAGPRAARRLSWLGMAFALLIGVSRVMDGAHSESEVMAGWALGFFVAAVLFRAISATERPRASSLRLILACMGALFVCYGHAAPIQSWILHTAPRLSDLLAR